MNRNEWFIYTERKMRNVIDKNAYPSVQFQNIIIYWSGCLANVTLTDNNNKQWNAMNTHIIINIFTCTHLSHIHFKHLSHAHTIYEMWIYIYIYHRPSCLCIVMETLWIKVKRTFTKNNRRIPNNFHSNHIWQYSQFNRFLEVHLCNESREKFILIVWMWAESSDQHTSIFPQIRRRKQLDLMGVINIMWFNSIYSLIESEIKFAKTIIKKLWHWWC